MQEVRSGRLGDVPGGSVVRNPPFNAEHVGLTLGLGSKIPHAAEEPSPGTAATESVNHSQRVCEPQ